MKRALILTAALLTACGNKDLTADEIRGALPQKEAAQINAPTGGPAVAKAILPDRAVSSLIPGVGDVSGYYVSTATLAAAVNGSVIFALGTLHAVVQLPPTHCDKASCTWGPGSHPLEPNEWKLTVTKVGDHYDYALAGQHKATPTGFVTVLSGSAWSDGGGRGHGTFLVDNDAAQALGNTDTGTLDVEYDNRTSPTIGATFLGFTGSDGHLGNAAYRYAEEATGGDLQVGFHDLTAAVNPSLRLHSRWNLQGAGRGDASYAQTAPAATYTASECWSSALVNPPFRVVFYADSTPASVGTEASCAFATASPPTISVP
jgi:hypothetical protein